MPHTVDDDDFASEAREDGRGGDGVADDDAGGGVAFEQGVDVRGVRTATGEAVLA